MTEPCSQMDSITELKENHTALHHQQQVMSGKMDTVLQNQEVTTKTFANYFERLEKILLAEVEHRKDIEQMKQDDERLYAKNREMANVVAELVAHKNSCDTLDIKGKVGTLWDGRNERQGIHKYRAEIIAGSALMLTVVGLAFKYL